MGQQWRGMVLDATIDGMSVKELKALITDGGLRFQDCTEKSELKARAREANEQLLQRMWERFSALSDEEMMEWIVDAEDNRLKAMHGSSWEQHATCIAPLPQGMGRRDVKMMVNMMLSGAMEALDSCKPREA